MEEFPALPALPPRPLESHKGHFGNALLVGGSRGMAGAIALAGMAAVRAGAGLVRLAVPDCCLETVASFSPCPMLIPVPNDPKGRCKELTDELQHWLGRSNCIAIGPGLGRDDSIDRFVFDLLRWVSRHHSDCPVVLDADGLVALSSRGSWRCHVGNPLVLTPHPGEWSRLSGVPHTEPQEQATAAVQTAINHRCTILLKGHRSLITSGSVTVRNTTGTPAMATGGSGDVLTGIITALICQGMETFNAARLGAHVHGLAGQIAAAQLKSHVVLPTELIQFLPAAFANVSSD